MVLSGRNRRFLRKIRFKSLLAFSLLAGALLLDPSVSEADSDFIYPLIYPLGWLVGQISCRLVLPSLEQPTRWPLFLYDLLLVASACTTALFIGFALAEICHQRMVTGLWCALSFLLFFLSLNAFGPKPPPRRFPTKLRSRRSDADYRLNQEEGWRARTHKP